MVKKEAFALAKLINVMLLGYVLSFVSIFLNWDADIKGGIVSAIVGIACSYFSEYMFLLGKDKPAHVLHLASIMFIASSYFIWLLS